MTVRQSRATVRATLPILAIALSPIVANAAEIDIQASFPPLEFKDSPPGGAHPIGGPTKAFVDHANGVLTPYGITFKLHVSGKVNPADEANGVLPPLVDVKEYGSLHKAVMRGKANGGIDAAAGIPADSNLAFGEMLSGGAPFGLEVDEFMGFIYAGGGLELLQRFYDEKFEGKIKVLPIAITSAQGAGVFPKPLPDPDTNANLTPEAAMAELCRTPMIVRWPEGGAAVWSEACRRVGVETSSTGRQTRCKDSAAKCDPAANPDNAVINEPKGLAFGGFAPGVLPHLMYANGNIDAYELNMPDNDVQFLKLAKKVQNEPDDAVDLKDIVPPYAYAGSWHQPSLMVELLINKDVWNGLAEKDRTLIEAAARSAVVNTQAARLVRQGAAIRLLQRQGVTFLRWPDGLIALLRAAAPAALNASAADFAAKGDDTMARLYKAMTDYQSEQAIFSDYGDITQGQAKLPTSPQ